MQVTPHDLISEACACNTSPFPCFAVRRQSRGNGYMEWRRGRSPRCFTTEQSVLSAWSGARDRKETRPMTGGSEAYHPPSAHWRPLLLPVTVLRLPCASEFSTLRFPRRPLCVREVTTAAAKCFLPAWKLSACPQRPSPEPVAHTRACKPTEASLGGLPGTTQPGLTGREQQAMSPTGLPALRDISR